jgi:hypothetical protein
MKIMRLFIFAYILAVLGSNVFLAVQYSFWVACVACIIMYINTIIVVAVIAYVGGSRPSWKSKSKIPNDVPDEIIAKEQVVLDDHKAA